MKRCGVREREREGEREWEGERGREEEGGVSGERGEEQKKESWKAFVFAHKRVWRW
jgi:hypothetical protein